MHHVHGELEVAPCASTARPSVLTFSSLPVPGSGLPTLPGSAYSLPPGKTLMGMVSFLERKSSWGCLRSRQQDKFLHGHPPPPEELKVGGRRGGGPRNNEEGFLLGGSWLQLALTTGHSMPTRALPAGTQLRN